MSSEQDPHSSLLPANDSIYFRTPIFAHYDNRKNSGIAGTGSRSKEVSLTSLTVNIR